MKVTITSTASRVRVNGAPARLWVGETDDGVPVHVYVATISPQTHDAAELEAFDRELIKLEYGPEIREGPIDLRFII